MVGHHLLNSFILAISENIDTETEKKMFERKHDWLERKPIKKKITINLRNDFRSVHNSIAQDVN